MARVETVSTTDDVNVLSDQAHRIQRGVTALGWPCVCVSFAQAWYHPLAGEPSLPCVRVHQLLSSISAAISKQYMIFQLRKSSVSSVGAMDNWRGLPCVCSATPPTFLFSCSSAADQVARTGTKAHTTTTVTHCPD